MDSIDFGGIWTRAIRDFSAGIQSAWFWLINIMISLITTVLGGERFKTSNGIVEIDGLREAIAFIAMMTAILVIVFSWHAVRASFRQRDEARTYIRNSTVDVDSIIEKMRSLCITDSDNNEKDVLQCFLARADILLYGSGLVIRDLAIPLLRLRVIEERTAVSSEQFVAKGAETLGGGATHGFAPTTIYSYHLTELGKRVLDRLDEVGAGTDSMQS